MCVLTVALTRRISRIRAVSSVAVLARVTCRASQIDDRTAANAEPPGTEQKALARVGGTQTFRTARNGMASDDKDIGWQVDLIQAI